MASISLLLCVFNHLVDGIRHDLVTVVLTDALPISAALFGFEHKRSEIEEKMAELRRRIDGAAPVPKAHATQKRTMRSEERRGGEECKWRRWARERRKERRRQQRRRRRRGITSGRRW